MHEQSRHLPELGRGQVTIETWAEKTTCATTRNKDMGGGEGATSTDQSVLMAGQPKTSPCTCLRILPRRAFELSPGRAHDVLETNGGNVNLPLNY